MNSRTLGIAIVFAISMALPVRFTAYAQEAEYVCPPCGHDCLKTVFDKPGACGVCGMQLIKLADALNMKPTQPSAAVRKKVAILIFDGVQIIDYTAPWEIFGQAGFDVFTVAKESEPLTTAFGMKVIPKHTLQTHPDPDILLIPGGQVFDTQKDAEIKAWLNKQAQQSEIVLSVCNGAFILAKAGLLDGLKATTTRHLVSGLANAAPNITVVHDTRFVDNGKIITSGGLSAGMDAALHVVERIQGRDVARRVADGIEYAWHVGE